MRTSASLLLALALALGLLGCETQPAASPASCGCGVKQNGSQPPPKEEPADIMR